MELIDSRKNAFSDVSIPYFDQRAPSYHLDSLRWPWSWLRTSEAAAVDKMMGGVAGLKVLDLGCGAGFYARRYVDKMPHRLIAVDLSAAMIDQITDSRIEGRVGDAAQIKIDENFDRIISAGLLEFVEDVKAVLVNARRHIQSNGQLILLVPINNFAGKLYRRFHQNNGITITLFNFNRLLTLATDSGWSMINHKFVYPFTLIATFTTNKNHAK